MKANKQNKEEHAMPNIVLSRIDERLIHGQVGVQWVGFAGANLVLVANDEVAKKTLPLFRIPDMWRSVVLEQQSLR